VPGQSFPLFLLSQVKEKTAKFGWTAASAAKICSDWSCPKEGFIKALWTDRRDSEYATEADEMALDGDLMIKIATQKYLKEKRSLKYQQRQEIIAGVNNRVCAVDFLNRFYGTVSPDGLSHQDKHRLSSQFECILAYSHRRRQVMRDLLAFKLPALFSHLARSPDEDSSSESSMSIGPPLPATLPPDPLPVRIQAPFHCPVESCSEHKRNRFFSQLDDLMRHAKAKHDLDLAALINLLKKPDK